MSDDELKNLLKAFAAGTIAYQRVYASIAGGVTGGLLLSQLVYWWYACGEREYYKTDVELRDETGLGTKEIRNAKVKLGKLKLIEIRVSGWPARTHYTINIPAILAQISSLTVSVKLCASLTETVKLVAPFRSNYKGTESNTETTLPLKVKGLDLPKDNEQQLGHFLLIHNGVSEKVASALVYEQKTPLASIEEAVKNGLAKHKYNGNFVLKAGYIVAALNSARKQGKLVQPTKLSKRLRKTLRRPERTLIGPEEFKRRKERQLRELRIG